MTRWLAVVTVLFGLACAPKSAPPQVAAEPAEPVAPVDEPNTPRVLRPFQPMRGEQPVIAGISYGPYREGQAPGGPNPSVEEIRQDLQLLEPHWGMLRFYSSTGPAEDILRVLRDDAIDIDVMLGVWISPEEEQANATEVAEAIRLANAYPGQVSAVNVGNETQVDWSAHRSDMDTLIGHIRTVRTAIEQPVTTADDYNFWNKPRSHAVADEVDFLLLHAYAMWNQQTLDDAVGWTQQTVDSIRREHPDLPIVMGETGWATGLNEEGHEVQYIKAPAGEAEQAAFYSAFTEWAAGAHLPYFYFEAFDEPWKGSDDPREVEKHWGLFNVDRTPKAAMRGVLDGE